MATRERGIDAGRVGFHRRKPARSCPRSRADDDEIATKGRSQELS